MIEQKIINDNYLEHEFHRTENGKIVPYARNAANCSTCFSKYQKIKAKVALNKRSGFTSEEDVNLTRNPEND